MWAGLQGWFWGEKRSGELGRVGWRVGRRKEEEKVIRTGWSAGEAEDPGSGVGGVGGEMSNRQGNPDSKPRVRGMEWKDMARWSGEPIPYLHPFFRMPVRPQGLGLLAPQRELTTLSPPTPPHPTPGVHTLVWEVAKSTCFRVGLTTGQVKAKGKNWGGFA